MYHKELRTLLGSYKLGICILCCVIGPELYGFNGTKTELGFTVKPELNRTFYSCLDVSSFGSLTLYNRFTMGGGVSLGTTGNIFDVKTFTKAELTPFLKIPLSISFHHIYNGMPAYKTHIQSIVPMISLGGRWAGLSLGPAWHFTVFNREEAIVESALAFSGYVNFYNTEKGRIGLKAANITDFRSSNMGAYFLQFYSLLGITKKCFLINDITLYQSGSVALTANFYGLAYRGGLLFRW